MATLTPIQIWKKVLGVIVARGDLGNMEPGDDQPGRVVRDVLISIRECRLNTNSDDSEATASKETERTD